MGDLDADGAEKVGELERLVERHRHEIDDLRKRVSACSEESAVLRTCLADEGLLHPSRFLAKQHRLRFAAALRKYPLTAEAKLDTALHTPGVALLIGYYSGWSALRATDMCSTTVNGSMKAAWVSIKDVAAGRIYVCGGSGGDVEAYASVECFNTATWSWEDVGMPQMRSPRCDASAQVIAGHLYVCGGYMGEASLKSVLSSVERLDPMTGVWEEMPHMLFARRGAVAGALEGKLYVCGGYDAFEQVLDLVECFDPRSAAVASTAGEEETSLGTTDDTSPTLTASRGCWEAMPLMEESRAEPAAGSVGGSLYICGGCGGGIWEQLRSVERFDPTTNGWEAMPEMLEPRSGAAGTSLGRRIFICGGMGSSVPTSVESFDTSIGVWEAMPTMTVARYAAAAAATKHCLYVFGGCQGWQHLNSAERFDPMTGMWEALPPMSQMRISPCAASLLIHEFY